MVCVPHLQDGRGAVHLACEGGHTQLVQTLVKEFGMSPDIRDNVSMLKDTHSHTHTHTHTHTHATMHHAI